MSIPLYDTQSVFEIYTINYDAVSYLFSACSLSVFENGGFENGDSNGWTRGGGDRNNIYAFNIKMDAYLPGGVSYDENISNQQLSIVSSGQDPLLLNRIPNIVFRGNYSLKIGDNRTGGYAALVSQRIDNYFCDDIYFAWLAVLEASHNESESSIVIIELKDITQGDTPIRKSYSAAASSAGTESLFKNATTENLFSIFYYTSWLTEHLHLNGTRRGHNFTLNVLSADCSQTGHMGYVYLDGFGGLAPQKDNRKLKTNETSSKLAELKTI